MMEGQLMMVQQMTVEVDNGAPDDDAGDRERFR